MDRNAYSLGQLLSLAVAHGWADEDAVRRVTFDLPGTLSRAIGKATNAKRVQVGREMISPLMEQIGDIPRALTNEQWADFWLGFYQGNAEKRQSKGDGLTERFEMKLSPGQKTWLMDNGGAAKIRELIDEARK